ncbi:hypothetical protein ACTHO0_19980 [Cytobacillus praedii]|uniref:hypothetical protein n=1 Tax=Cytobacillus praedii TaxID=1742358 RepID=UPI003F80571B
MKSLKILLSLSILFILLAGCNNGYPGSPSAGNPTAKDYLKYDNADIFLLDGYVFSIAKDVEWVTELEYKLGEQIGEITVQANKAYKFKNGTANKLPVGAKIFATDTSAYIVIVEGEDIPYLKMVEG